MQLVENFTIERGGTERAFSAIEEIRYKDLCSDVAKGHMNFQTARLAGTS